MTPDKNKKIFTEFEGVSKEVWIELALKDLKEKKNVFENIDEGFEVAPFYSKDDLNHSIYAKIPASFNPHWKYLEYINLNDLKEANTITKSVLNNGADGIIFDLDQKSDLDFKKLLKEIYPEYCSISFQDHYLNIDILNNYFKYIISNNFSKNEINGAFLYDPITEWTLNPQNKFPEIEPLKELFLISAPFENFKCFGISSEIFKNSGATLVQEGAFTICSLIEYVRILSDIGIQPESIIKKIWLNISVGNNYFFEIAKLRAIRSLILQISKVYDIPNLSLQEPSIHVNTSWWTKTAKDPYTNILRNTTEAMAGILGGCSAISILPHDVILKDHNDFSRRISRNISLILKEEAYFDKVSDPLAGSYYIENLTHTMLQKIWDNVQEIEKHGGFIKAFNNGFIKNMVAPNYKKSIQSVIKAKKKIIGSNYYENKEDIDLIINTKTKRKGWFEWNRIVEILEQKNGKV